VASSPSEIHRWQSQALGAPQSEAELFRARGRATGTWIASYDAKALGPQDRLRLTPRRGDETVIDHGAAAGAVGLMPGKATGNRDDWGNVFALLRSYQSVTGSLGHPVYVAPVYRIQREAVSVTQTDCGVYRYQP
jgi:hypothetical protein